MGQAQVEDVELSESHQEALKEVRESLEFAAVKLRQLGDPFIGLSWLAEDLSQQVVETAAEESIEIKEAVSLASQSLSSN